MKGKLVFLCHPNKRFASNDNEEPAKVAQGK